MAALLARRGLLTTPPNSIDDLYGASIGDKPPEVCDDPSVTANALEAGALEAHWPAPERIWQQSQLSSER
jgi:hypothetical protein